MNLGTHMPDGGRRKPIDILFCLVIESACLLSRAFYLQVCFFYLYVFDFCCQLAYGYVLMLILLHASALLVCLYETWYTHAWG
jgi:hypothetical protein